MQKNKNYLDTSKQHLLSNVLRGSVAFRNVFVWKKVNIFLDFVLLFMEVIDADDSIPFLYSKNCPLLLIIQV